MAFLAALALLFSLSADRLRKNWQDELELTATVQIMVETQELRETNIQTALDALKADLPDATIAIVSEDKAKELLRPWLGNIDLPDDLPLPALLSISADANERINPDKLVSRLNDEGIIAEVDDHSRWSEQIGRSGRGIKAAALALLVLIFGASIAVSVFATQAALSAQRDVIRVLVQVGAEDRFISKLFIRQAGLRGLKGGAIGAIFGAVVGFVYVMRRATETALLPELTLRWTDMIFLLGLIICFALICAITAGLTSYHILRSERRRA